MIDGRTVIDRLVYPTLGNPNLYVKDDANDELTMVLRIEPNAFDHLAPKSGAAQAGEPSELALTQDDQNGFAFFLVARAARARAPRARARRAPTPASTRSSRRRSNQTPSPTTCRRRSSSARRSASSSIKPRWPACPPGLYDARFEVKKAGQVFANVFEYQYNSVRVFEHASEEYTALNVTDTQVSVGDEYKSLTADKLDDFVDAVNANAEPAVQTAAFITFNGDLHNGGSPGTLRQRTVASTYNDEAKRILGALKRLNLPIFLTAGNHDGYASSGQAPSAVVDGRQRSSATTSRRSSTSRTTARGRTSLGTPTPRSSEDATTHATASIATSSPARSRARSATRSRPSFAEVPRAERNMVLYDGFHQWQKTYGPLYSSWSFGKNRYVSMNTYELRQHRRTGWGMYTVNYGGAVGTTQLEWLDRELGRATPHARRRHRPHAPRPARRAQGQGPRLLLPDAALRRASSSRRSTTWSTRSSRRSSASRTIWSLTVNERESCLHDGLQEWMGPDEDFETTSNGFYMSGVELLARIAKNPQVRTLLIGHAHLNSLEVVQQGEVLVPNKRQPRRRRARSASRRSRR